MNISKDKFDAIKFKGVKLSWENIEFETHEQLNKFMTDPDQFEADYIGVTVTEMLTSREQAGLVRCCARTKSGSRCRNTIGAAHYNIFIRGMEAASAIRAWAARERSGELCHIHA